MSFLYSLSLLKEYIIKVKSVCGGEERGRRERERERGEREREREREGGGGGGRVTDR